MPKAITTYIKNLRERAGLTQEAVAGRIGVSRPTYVQIEKGERELMLSEVKKLADLFHVSLVDFLSARETAEPHVELEVSKEKKKTGLDIRISVSQKNVAKFKEVLLYVLEHVGAKPNIGETAIYKLLYFIDFDFYEKFEEQLIGARYQKNKYGPTPMEFKKIVETMKERGELVEVKSKYFQYEQKKYLPLREPDLSKLSAQELELINDVLVRLSDKSAKELSDYSHGDVPWQVHKDGEEISYESVFYRDRKYSVRNYDDEL